jgi:hypothetical protein
MTEKGRYLITLFILMDLLQMNDLTFTNLNHFCSVEEKKTTILNSLLFNC